MNRTLLLIFASALAVCLVVSGSQTSFAQDDAFILEEIIVTSQKREQHVQDVPIAITVTDGVQMEQQRIYTLQDLSRTTAALEFGDPNQGPGGAAVIRGLGTDAFDMGLEPSVGVVVDNVPQGASNAGNLFDVARVEVLRGPQGTLFGNASSAGVINIVTNSPKLSMFEGKIGVDATADDILGSKFGRQEIRAMMNIPVTGNSALRVIANANLMQDFLRNKAPGAENQDVKNYGFRARYLYQPNDEVSVNLIAEYADTNRDGPNLFTLADISTSDPLYDYFTGLGIKPSDQNQDIYHSTFDFFEEQKSYSLSAQIDWAMGNHDFVSITSYRDEDVGPNSQNIFGYEWTHNLLEVQRIGIESTTDTFTQEFRISSPADGKFIYLAGLYYNSMERTNEASGTSQTFPPVPPPPFGPPAFLVPTLFPAEPYTSRADVENKNYAVFADATYSVTDAFTLLGGLRYSVYDFSLRNEDIATGEVNTDGVDEGYFSFRAGMQYKVNPDTMVYATVSRGIKTPIVSPPPVTEVDAEYTLVQAEIPTSYEVGVKLTAFNNRVAVDLNGFYTDVEDYQAQVCEYGENDELVCEFTNADGVTSKGIEIDIFGHPSAGLTINVGYLFNIAEYPSDFADVAGEQLRNAPKHKFVFNTEYEQSLTESILGFIGFDTVYKSDKRINTDLRPYAVLSSHWKYGARIGIRGNNDKWNLSLFGRNLSSEPEPVGKFGFGESVVWQVLTEKDLRQVGLSFNMNF